MSVPTTIRRGLAVSLLALPALLLPTRSDAQQVWLPPNLNPTRMAIPSTRRATHAPRGVHAASQVSLATVTESEPNDSFINATLLTLGDTASGIMNPSGDVDWYAVDLTAGTSVVFDMDAYEIGSGLWPFLSIYTQDGGGGLVELSAYNLTSNFDPLYWLLVPTTGRYYLRIDSFWGEGSPDYFYTLKIMHVVPPPPGPGEPTTLLANGGMNNPFGMAAAGNGDIYVADIGQSSILRVDAAGTVSPLIRGIPQPRDVAIDGTGDLLIAASEDGVLRVTPSGERSTFVSNFRAVSITVDHDGDIWVGGASDTALEIRHYSATGTLKSARDVTNQMLALVSSGIAVSPTGDVYASNWRDGVFRVSGGPPTRVITTPLYCIWDLAFDADGYLYVSNCMGQVVLYDPAFHLVVNPFARTNGGPIVFGRDAAGGMTSRLFEANGIYNAIYPPLNGGIVELNPAAMRAPGLRVGVDFLRMATTTLRPGFIAVPYADTLRLADAPGPVTWSVTNGALPAGIALDSTTGIFSGRPERFGPATFTVRGTSGERFGVGTFTLSISTINVPATVAAKAFLGESGAVSPEEEHLLDQLGNGNGRLDVADFRAYLQSLHMLAAPTQKATP